MRPKAGCWGRAPRQRSARKRTPTSGTRRTPGRAFILTSHDGGATWSWKQKLASPYTFMVTESRWLQLAPDKAETVNGGQAFGPFTSDLRGVSPSAVFADADLGYAAADGALQ